MKKEIKNLPASIQAKLKRHAQETGHSFQEVFYYYANERFLYRLSKSQYCKSLILKGGLAFFGWGINLRRPTRDIDFQSYLENNVHEIVRIVTEICGVSVEDDGMVFDTESIEGQTIMVDTDYEGVRVRFMAYLGRAFLWQQIDFSFANVITPREINVEYPTILDMPNFQLRGYNRETAIAEKFQAMVFLGGINDRLKDFFDIYLLSQECNFNGELLVKSIVATFKNRDTAIPLNVPMALSDAFVLTKQTDWLHFMKRVKSEGIGEVSLLEVIETLREFLLPPTQAAARGEDFSSEWQAGRGWRN